jgi:4-diphosphocytidyl-2-C-methyl-D-erythritol kinase
MTEENPGVELWARAPAKINLHLELLARRNDGFHELETLMAPISIFDSLSFTATSDEALTLSCVWEPGIEARRTLAQRQGTGSPWEPLPAPQSNLAWRALSLLREESGAESGGCLRIVKRIPAAAGLGGASSDAASTLCLANRAWGLGWSTERLATVAAKLGSDVPFFLYGGAAVCRGRGEQIEQLGAVPRLHVVVVRPRDGLSTAAVYGLCEVPDVPISCNRITRDLLEGDSGRVAKGLHNRLQAPAALLSPIVSDLAKLLQHVGGVGYLMSGSGTSHFVVCWNRRHAQAIAGRLRSMGVGVVHQASTL